MFMFQLVSWYRKLWIWSLEQSFLESYKVNCRWSEFKSASATYGSLIVMCMKFMDVLSNYMFCHCCVRSHLCNVYRYAKLVLPNKVFSIIAYGSDVWRVCFWNLEQRSSGAWNERLWCKVSCEGWVFFLCCVWSLSRLYSSKSISKPDLRTMTKT